MLYNAFSLDGDYVMDYTEEDYTSESVPEFTKNASPVKGAIPGYFEDMTDKLQKTNFYGKLRVNPEYGAQHYPIAGVAPDMALPNVYGTFFYSRKLNLESISDGVTIAFPQVHIATAVWLNGRFLGRHIGYSTHFEIEVPKDALLLGENELCIAVSNHRQGGFDNQPVTGITSRAASEYSGGISDHVEMRVYRSPLRGKLTDIAPELYAFKDFVSTPRFSLVILFMEAEQYIKTATKGRSRPRYKKYELIPVNLLRAQVFKSLDDYKTFVPDTLDGEFTVKDFGAKTKIRGRDAYLTIYSLRDLGLIEECGKIGRAKSFKKTF